MFAPNLDASVDALCTGNNRGYIYDPADKKRYVGIIHLHKNALGLDILIHESMHLALSYLAPRLSKVVKSKGSSVSYMLLNLDTHEEELCYTLEWILTSLVHVISHNYPGSISWIMPSTGGMRPKGAVARPRYPRGWK